MTEQISIMLDSEDKKNFEEFTGMKFVDGMKLLMDNIKYGGQLGLAPFWSEENQKCSKVHCGRMGEIRKCTRNSMTEPLKSTFIGK